MIATEPNVVKVTIRVTEADIAQGERMANDKCAIALAMLRAFDVPQSDCFPSVGSRTAFLPSGEEIELPAVAKLFINSFDNERTVWPFIFDLVIPLDAAA